MAQKPFNGNALNGFNLSAMGCANFLLPSKIGRRRSSPVALQICLLKEGTCARQRGAGSAWIAHLYTVAAWLCGINGALLPHHRTSALSPHPLLSVVARERRCRGRSLL